jgi:hypothetical protein
MNDTGTPSAASDLPFPRVPDVIFTNWREALHLAGLGAGVQTVYSMAISGYLEYCALNAISVTTASARAYMEDVQRRGLARQPDLWKEGLNWFFREGRQHTSTRENRSVPVPGQESLYSSGRLPRYQAPCSPFPGARFFMAVSKHKLALFGVPKCKRSAILPSLLSRLRQRRKEPPDPKEGGNGAVLLAVDYQNAHSLFHSPPDSEMNHQDRSRSKASQDLASGNKSHHSRAVQNRVVRLIVSFRESDVWKGIGRLAGQRTVLSAPILADLEAPGHYVNIAPQGMKDFHKLRWLGTNIDDDLSPFLQRNPGFQGALDLKDIIGIPVQSVPSCPESQTDDLPLPGQNLKKRYA